MQPDFTASSRRIARQILDLMSEARFDPGHHLREQYLADALGTSRTSIRAELKELTRMGAVKARPDQGFPLPKRSSELDQLEIEQSKSDDQKSYERLVHDRIAGTLPESFTRTGTSQRYDVDHGVLTRALVKLSEGDLIARNARHGWHFLQALNSGIALRNNYGSCLMIGPTALLTPNLHVDRQMLKRLRIRHPRLITHPDVTQVPAEEIFEADVTFHELLTETNGDLFVSQAIQQQNRPCRLLEFGSYHNKCHVREWCEEHVVIVDALQKNRQEQTAELMRKHLQYAFDQVNVKNPRI